MKKFYGTKFVFLITVITSLLFSAVPIDELIRDADIYDRKKVEITGEVIGDILLRKEEAWLNVLSPEGTAIGVLCRQSQTDSIRAVGDYDHKGDIIAVTGIFHKFSPRQGGETMVLAENVRIVKPGYEIKHRLPAGRVLSAVLLFLTAVFLRIMLDFKKKK